MGYSPWGHKRVGHNLATEYAQSYFTSTPIINFTVYFFYIVHSFALNNYL